MTPTLCLNMIVKNESAILPRLFDSVCSLIDCYCICDTGSDDDTVDVIQSYFGAKGIPGKLIHEPFQNFGYNRNVALRACLGMSDYVLLLDADMVLKVHPSFDKTLLSSADGWVVLQGTPAFYYQNPRIVRNDGIFTYVGMTHEYLNKPETANFQTLSKEQMFVLDIGDGGSKQDKYVRDAKLLLEGIQQEPNNARYYFYLANTYHDMGDFEKAIPMYQKRIDIGGWKEEVWCSHFRMGLCYMKLGQMANASWQWLAGFNYYPQRLEGLYELVRYYRIQGQHLVAFALYHWCKPFLELPANMSRDSCLFLHNEVYAYKLYYEYTILAYYNGVTRLGPEAMAVFNCPMAHSAEIDNLLSNLKFYPDVLTPLSRVEYDHSFACTLRGERYTFHSSSSCLVPLERVRGGYGMNVRYVNYTIDPSSGQYLNCDQRVVTVNKWVELDNELGVVHEDMMELHIDEENKRYIGVEDIRLFNDVSGQLQCIGTALQSNGRLGMVAGVYKTNRLAWRELSQGLEPPRVCEKNWVYVHCFGETHMVYDWHPLRIGKLDSATDTLQLVATRPMPRVFERARGSTCGCAYQNEVWFVVHMVSYESPRHYYHMLCVFDQDMQLKRYSAPFKFEGAPIEYCLSIVVEDSRVLLNYSTWDRTTRIGIYDKTYLEGKLCFR